jgi:hypothetical protein
MYTNAFEPETNGKLIFFLEYVTRKIIEAIIANELLIVNTKLRYFLLKIG